MRSLSPFLLFASSYILFHPILAVRLLSSESLNPCQDNSSITATLFHVVFTPDNNTLSYDISADSSVTGRFTVILEVIAYGYTAVQQTIDPCQSTLSSNFCPIQQTGPMNFQGTAQIPNDIVSKVPGVAFTVPDLDGKVRFYIHSQDAGGKPIACVEAELSNGKTVYQGAVSWITAVIVGLGLTAAAIASGLGFSNTAAHVAANALSLFGFFQSLAMVGMTAIPMPPIVESWTQNFQWTMGIVRVQFMQAIFTWYQRATRGTPSVLLSDLSTMSVQVQKRSFQFIDGVTRQLYPQLAKRDNSASADSDTISTTVIKGIGRVGFRAHIEETNIFMTALTWFITFIFLTTLAAFLFKGYCTLATRYKWMKNATFQDLRTGWADVMRGILFRLILMGYPPMCVLCLWELTERDSAAEVALAILTFLSISVALGWAATKVIQLAKRSQMMHHNPAYFLYSNPKVLHTWGFLYVQYRATAYYVVVPTLIYILTKSAFIGLAQGSGVTQAFSLAVIEIAALLAAIVYRPWMDKKTNAFNIAISSVHAVNAIFLLMFTSVFGQPAVINGIMGVIFFIYNAVFAIVFLVLLLIASAYAILSKNPDIRYETLRDDRSSFIKSQPHLSSELDGLAATARGDVKGLF